MARGEIKEDWKIVTKIKLCSGKGDKNFPDLKSYWNFKTT